MPREWTTGGAAPGGVRSSPTSNQHMADAEWMLEHIMQRQNWIAATRDAVAEYIELIAADKPRGGKLIQRTMKRRKNL